MDKSATLLFLFLRTRVQSYLERYHFSLSLPVYNAQNMWHQNCSAFQILTGKKGNFQFLTYLFTQFLLPFVQKLA